MGGLIKVWKVESKDEIWSFEVGDLEVKLGWCISKNLLGNLLLLTEAGGICEEMREGRQCLCYLILTVSAVPRLQWLEWHPCAPVLLAGTDDGSVWMWKIPSGDCKTFQSAACQATTGKVLPDGQ